MNIPNVPLVIVYSVLGLCACLLFFSYLSAKIVEATVLQNAKKVSCLFEKTLLFAAVALAVGLIAYFVAAFLLIELPSSDFWLEAILRLVLKGYSTPDQEYLTTTLLCLFILCVYGLASNFLLNVLITFKDRSYSVKQRLIASLITALMTAPYFVFVSFESLL